MSILHFIIPYLKPNNFQDTVLLDFMIFEFDKKEGRNSCVAYSYFKNMYI